MGRPPGNGAPAFRFHSNEVTEMENILREYKGQVPSREVLEALAVKFSSSEERSGKIKVQVKQVWNWFQNRRFALRAKQTKPPEMFTAPPPLPRFNSGKNVNQAPQNVASPESAQGSGRPVSDNASLEFEAKSARDGAWYDVASFLSHRSLETDEPDVLVRFAGFGSEEDEWVNVRKHVRPRSLPCESSECVAILPGDLILCFQEGKEQALYYDAHVIDSQRRRHDLRGCRCRFLVRYDHDQSEEIVPLRKVCRRPETDYRLLQLQSMNESGATKQQKTNAETPHMGNTLRVYPPSEPIPKQQKPEESLSHGNRSISAEIKNMQTKNPEMGAGVALKNPAIPPGFEAVTSEATKSSNNISGGDTPVAMEVKSLETSNSESEVITTEDGSLEKENSEVITPSAKEIKTLETKIPETSGGVVEISTIPPGFEAVINSTTTQTPKATEIISPETKKPEVGAGDARETLPVLPINEALTSGAVTNSTVSDDTPVAPVIKSQDMKISTVPPGFEAVTSENTPVAMEIEIPEMKNSEVIAGEAGGTSKMPLINKAVTSGANPNSKIITDMSVSMEVEPLQIKDPKVSAGDAGETSTILPDNKNASDLTENMLEG